MMATAPAMPTFQGMPAAWPKALQKLKALCEGLAR